MGYRNVFSQMFDVRPLTERGDLDLERIKKIQHILDLARKNKVYLKLGKDYEANRVINLRKKIVQKLIPISAKKLKKKDKKPIQIFSDEQVLKSLLAGNNSIRWGISSPEVDEISYPSREEILATLEEIEEANRYLEEYGLEEVEPSSDVAELKAEIEELQTDRFFDLDQFLKPQESDIILESVVELEAKLAPPLSFLVEAEISPEVLSAKEQILFEPTIELEKKSRSSTNLVKNFFGWVNSKISYPEIIKTQRMRQVAGFVGTGFLIWLVIFGLSLAGQGLSAKSNILGSGLQAYQAMLAGADSAAHLNFSAAQVNFANAYQDFLQANQELNKMGRALVTVLEQLPGGSVVGSGVSLIEAGKNLAQAGQGFSRIGNLLAFDKIGDYFSGAGQPLTQKIVEIQKELDATQSELANAQKNLDKVKTADLPPDVAPALDSFKDKLPLLVNATAELNNWSGIFLEILGHQQAKKYLLIFQNTAEAKATGGFIGSYGVLDLDQGRIRNLSVVNVFDLDGQLNEKVIPPQPIQKISTAWSMHDANWFADFPTSAQKIMWFYEKAGGATPDGIISLTPEVIERLLAITGPIDMPEYNSTFNQDNFIDLLQYKVETDYDKIANQPKQILADFVPKFLAKLWTVWPSQYDDIFKDISDSLVEKQILFYFSDPSLEKIFMEEGWTGEILPTDKNYLSVVNTNINGYKTDKVIEQKIYHSSQVQSDGSIIDTVKIMRTHTGGRSQYDWYNCVNADYLRVYVPLGSKLLSAQGHTLEVYSAPVDYQKLNFKIDADVAAEEEGMTVDSNSGTQIFKESGKTVFGNWVYVSPGETVEVTYQHLLPFKLNLNADNFSYSLLAQKQSGSAASAFESILQLPQEYKINWQYPENLQISGSQIKFSGDLKTDEFYGVVFGQ